MGDMFVNREALDQVLSQLRINSSVLLRFGSGLIATGGTSTAGAPVFVPRDATEMQVQVVEQTDTGNVVTVSDGQGTSPKVLLLLGGTQTVEIVMRTPARLDVREYAGKTIKINSDGALAVLVNFMGRGNH